MENIWKTRAGASELFSNKNNIGVWKFQFYLNLHGKFGIYSNLNDFICILACYSMFVLLKSEPE